MVIKTAKETVRRTMLRHSNNTYMSSSKTKSLMRTAKRQLKRSLFGSKSTHPYNMGYVPISKEEF